MDHISCSRFFSIPGIDPPDLPAELSGAGSCFVPNCWAAGEPQRDFERGYGLWAALQRFDPPRLLQRRPAEAVGFLIGHGEVLANPDNQVTLAGGPGDAWGLPVPRITCRWGPNEQAMVCHMQARMQTVVRAAGGSLQPIEELFVVPLVEPLLQRAVATAAAAAPAGYYIHEMGGAPMATTEAGGVLNPWNQCWRASNVLVTDGACWPSSGWQSPTLTTMALTWRACEAAAQRLRQGDQGLA
jgi:choline dehydrogenase-like flavoprotein